MDLTKLKYFLRICEENNISKAAQGLFLTQQGLSKAIISLEKELTVPLFYRTSEGMVLTKYGEAIKEEAQRILSSENKMRESIRSLQESQQVQLTVYLSLGVQNSFPEELMDKFSFLHPNIELNWVEYKNSACQKAVADHDDCVGIVVGPVDHSIFDSHLLKSHTPHAIVNTSHPLAEKAHLKLEDLDQQDVIIVNQEFQIYHNFIDACKRKNVVPNIVQTTGEIYLTYKMSHLNKGIGISVDFISEDIKYSNVKSIPILCDSFTWDVVVIRKKNAALSWAAKAWIDYLSAIVQPVPGSDCTIALRSARNCAVPYR